MKNLVPLRKRWRLVPRTLWLCALAAGPIGFGAKLPEAQPVRHVLLISIDGMHALDLAHFIKSQPESTLAQLASSGITYTEAFTARPSDSFPGLMSMVTGGSPNSTGIWYEGSYARLLSPPGSNCNKKGVEVVWDASVDRNKKLADGGGINPAKLPLDPQKGCAAVYPHDYLRVNTIFEVVHEAGMRTAWIDKHPSYEMTNGPSGHGVDDLFTPEISATEGAHEINAGEVYDDGKIAALLNEINGKDHSGAKNAEVPALMGVALQDFTTAQKTCGYTDASGTLTPPMLEALKHLDESLGNWSKA